MSHNQDDVTIDELDSHRYRFNEPLAKVICHNSMHSIGDINLKSLKIIKYTYNFQQIQVLSRDNSIHLGASQMDTTSIKMLSYKIEFT